MFATHLFKMILTIGTVGTDIGSTTMMENDTEKYGMIESKLKNVL